MRWIHASWGKVAGLGALVFLTAMPAVLPCVKSRDLVEQIGFAGDEVVYGQVISMEEQWLELEPGYSMTYTTVDLRVHESLRTGQKDFDLRFAFVGGVQPDSPTTSITPSPQDVAVGRNLVLFLAERPFVHQELGQDVYTLDSYAEVYRVEKASGLRGDYEVVLGKGFGMALPTNTTLEDARAQVRAAYDAQIVIEEGK